MLPLATNYLVPSPPLVVIAALVLLVGVVWPLCEAISRRRLGWAIAIVVLAPLAGLLWLAVGRWQGRAIRVA